MVKMVKCASLATRQTCEVPDQPCKWSSHGVCSFDEPLLDLVRKTKEYDPDEVCPTSAPYLSTFRGAPYCSEVFSKRDFFTSALRFVSIPAYAIAELAYGPIGYFVSVAGFLASKAVGEIAEYGLRGAIQRAWIKAKASMTLENLMSAFILLTASVVCATIKKSIEKHEALRIASEREEAAEAAKAEAKGLDKVRTWAKKRLDKTDETRAKYLTWLEGMKGKHFKTSADIDFDYESYYRQGGENSLQDHGRYAKLVEDYQNRWVDAQKKADIADHASYESSSRANLISLLDLKQTKRSVLFSFYALATDVHLKRDVEVIFSPLLAAIRNLVSKSKTNKITDETVVAVYRSAVRATALLARLLVLLTQFYKVGTVLQRACVVAVTVTTEFLINALKRSMPNPSKLLMRIFRVPYDEAEIDLDLPLDGRRSIPYHGGNQNGQNNERSADTKATLYEQADVDLPLRDQADEVAHSAARRHRSSGDQMSSGM